MISEEFSAAIIEDDIQKIRYIVFKEMPLRLPDEYYIEALEISNKHQRSLITDYIQLTRLYRLLIERMKSKSASQQLVLMIREILKQLYKFYDCKTNKLIALHSIIAAKDQSSLYATRNHLGEYQVIVHRKVSNKYYHLSKTGVEPYDAELLTDEYSAPLLEQEANHFMARVKAAYTKFSEPASALPLDLQESITKDMLLDTYAYILNTPNILEPLTRGHHVRIDKHHSTLQRTCNILLNESKECMLMLETKRKKSDNTKDDNKVIGKGTYGTVKPTWRIDSDVLEEWANKTAKGTDVFQTEYESNFSEKIIANCNKEQSELFNHTIQSEVFYKETFKHSQYSKRAIADLETIEKENALSLKNKFDIFGDILQAIDLMHQKGKIHQDIKLANILIYKGERYYAKLTDFGISEDIFKPLYNDALSTKLFASPEILIATSFRSSPYYAYFHLDEEKQYSFSYQIYLMTEERWYDGDNPIIINYKLPHPSNDMWALGILLFKLLYNRYPKNHSQDRALIENDPLLSGLLKVNRQQRMTAKEAKEMYPQWVETKLANPRAIAPLYEMSKPSASSSSASSASQNEWSIVTSNGSIPLSALFKKA